MGTGRQCFNKDWAKDDEVRLRRILGTCQPKLQVSYNQVDKISNSIFSLLVNFLNNTWSTDCKLG